MYTYEAEVKRIVDGDTYDLIVDLGFSLKAEIRVRLRGVDTPEIYRPSCDEELEHGREASEFVSSVMPVGSAVKIQTYKLGIYGRYDADIFISGKSLAGMLYQNGFAKRESYGE